MSTAALITEALSKYPSPCLLHPDRSTSRARIGADDDRAAYVGNRGNARHSLEPPQRQRRPIWCPRGGVSSSCFTLKAAVEVVPGPMSGVGRHRPVSKDDSRPEAVVRPRATEAFVGVRLKRTTSIWCKH